MESGRMKLKVNGKDREVPANSRLADLVTRRPGVAVAVNGEVVRNWELVLHDDDAVEVLSAFQGG
jgi:thiamine biosynthesis protein ThiS